MYLTKIARKILQRDEAILAASGPLDAITPSNGAWWVVKERDGSGNLVDQTGGGRNLTLPGGSANPVLLDHTGTDYFWFPGTTGNYLSVPDSAALSVTGDIEIQMYLTPDDWTPSALMVPLSKQSNAYRVGINTDGTLGITVDGVKDYWSTVASGLTNGVGQWVKWTLDVDNGAGGSVARVYLGGSGVSPSWSQLGSDITHTSTVSFTDNASALLIGGRTTSTFMYLGGIRQTIIKDGIDGTTVLDVRASDADPDATTFVEASSNAATVTINRSSTGYKTAVVDQPMYVFATDDYLSASDAAVFDVEASDSFSVVTVMRFHDYPATEGFVIGKRANLVTASKGWVVYIDASKRVIAELSDGTVEQGGGIGGDFDTNITDHLLQGYGAVRDVGSDLFYSYVEENALGSGNTDNTTGTLENAEPVEVGGAFYYSAVELVGAAFIKGTAWTNEEISDIADALITANGGTP